MSTHPTPRIHCITALKEIHVSSITNVRLFVYCALVERQWTFLPDRPGWRTYACLCIAFYPVLTPVVGTQEDQDQYDERIRKKALSELVESWMDRLQLISVIVSCICSSTRLLRKHAPV